MNLKLSKNRVFKYILFVINSILTAFAYILLQRNHFSEGGSSKPLFTLQRIIIFSGVLISAFLILFICSIGQNRRKIEKFVEKIGTHPMLTVALAVIIFRLWYSSFYNTYILYYDTNTYTVYPFNIFLGETDIFRTPGYPYFLKFISFFTRNYYLDAKYYHIVVLLQSILSMISVIVLYFAGKKLFKNKYILSIAALIYGIAPCVFSWDACILTESLSLFCTVLLIYFLFSYLASPKMYKAIILGIYSFFMIMVRPAFIYLLAILAVFFIVRFILLKKDRKNCVAGFVSVLVSISLVFGYCGLNYKNYNYFKISSVSATVNNLYIVMMNDWIKNDDYPELSEHMSNEINAHKDGNWITDIVELVPDYFSYNEIDNYVSDCISKHRKEFIEYTLNKTGYLLNADVASQYTVLKEENKDFKAISDVIIKITFPFTFFHCFILVVIGLLFALLVLVLKKRICWQVIGLCALIFTHIFVSVYGSMAEFPRLCSMVIPAVILLVFYFADYLVYAIKKQKLFCFDKNNSTEIEIRSAKSRCILTDSCENVKNNIENNKECEY